jgi:hypothetical protein
MAWLNEFARESLPTTWSRLTAVATLSTAAACIWLPEFLQKIGLSIAETETLSSRLAVVFAILFLGSLVTLAQVVRAYDRLVDDHATEIEFLKKSKLESVEKIQQAHAKEIEKITNRSSQSHFPEPDAINPQGTPYFSAAPNNRKP